MARTAKSPLSQQQQSNTKRCSSCPVSVIVAFTFALALIHLGWSLSQTSQISFSFLSQEMHHHATTVNNYFLVLPDNSTLVNTLNLPSMDDLTSLPSKWFVSEAQQKKEILKDMLAKDPRPFVSIVLCMKSQAEWVNISDTSLHTLLIPSLIKTITPAEFQNYRIELLVGFDVGDKFWENKHHRHLLMELTTKQQPHLKLNFLSLRKQRPHQIPFNAACRAAYELGADYIVRINDDTEFVTQGWVGRGIHALSKSYHPPNLGVVGPKCDQGNVEILTHDMVHRLHLDIFDMQYYPDEFDNWWIDDWISRVYGRNNTRQINSWEVYHHIDKHGTRYRVDDSQRQHLEMTVQRGRARIRAYLKQQRAKNGRGGELRLPKSQMEFKAIGNNQRIPAAWGPSMDRFYNNK